jgi:MFS family permease
LRQILGAVLLGRSSLLIAEAPEIHVNIQQRNVSVLAACQALLFVNNSTVLAVNALAGRHLAELRGLGDAFATVPVTGWIIGTALATVPAAQLMRRYGRRMGFTTGALIGIAGALLASAALYVQSFWLLSVGTLIFGAYNGFAQQYRFAAADSAAPERRAQVIGTVLAGGLIGGLIGPQLSTVTIDLFATQYLGAYLVLVVFLVAATLLIQLLRVPLPSTAQHDDRPRALGEIGRQPAFIVAVVGAALGYAVMNLLMVATPLAMTGAAGHAYHSAAGVISAHVVGMFGPSFFTGTLIRRFGALNVMLTGALLQTSTIIIALSGTSVPHFGFALVLLGVGWNFLYIGGTALLTECYRPSEAAMVQGINELLIALLMVVTSFSSGFLLASEGWNLLNYVSSALVAGVGFAIVWLMVKRRARAVATA